MEGGAFLCEICAFDDLLWEQRNWAEDFCILRIDTLGRLDIMNAVQYNRIEQEFAL